MSKLINNAQKAIDRVHDIEAQIKEDILQMMSDVFSSDDKLNIPDIPSWLRKRAGC